MSAQEMQAQVIGHLLSTAVFADAHCTNPVPFDLAKGKFGPNLSEAIRTLSGEYLQQDEEVRAAEARIAELEMFKRQWAVADAALVSAHRRAAELEAELDEMKKNLHK